MFTGYIDTRWLDDGRQMWLLADFQFTDSQGRIWIAHLGDIIDGASIPRLLWRVAGSPFVGLHRKASVIHDVYCVTRRDHLTGAVIPHEEVHHCYKEMLLAAGVGEWEASKKMVGRLDLWAEVG